MSFKESFETVSKEEIVSDAIDSFKKEEKDLYNDIDNKEDATEKNTKKLYYEKLLEKNEPNIAELITKYKMEIDYDDKEVVVPFKIEFSNGGSAEPTINDYKVILTKDGVKVKGKLDENWSISGDEKYQGSLDSIMSQIEDELIKRAGRNGEELSEKIHDKLEATKKVFTTLFMQKIK